MDNSKTSYKFTSIKDLMQKVLNNNKLDKGINLVLISDAWRKVMGEGVWTYTTAVKLNNGILIISLRSSTIREELNYRKEDIINMLNAHLKTDLVKKIRLV